MCTEEDTKRILELLEENNAILRSMQRRARISEVFAILKVVIYVGLIGLSFFAIQPYLNQLQDVYLQTQELKAKVSAPKNSIDGLIDQFRGAAGMDQRSPDSSN